MGFTFRHGLFLLLAIASGCAESHGESAYEAHVATLQRSTCERYFECCTSAGREGLERVLGRVPTDVEDCVLLIADPELTMPVVEDLAEGRATFDPEAARTCEENVRALSCEEWNTRGFLERPADACERVVVGAAAVGDACESHSSCGPEGFCEGAEPGVPGVCVARLAEGDACVPGRDVCPTYHTCLRDPGARGMTCQPLRRVGEPCGEALDCESLTCSGLGVCAAPPPQCG